MSTRWRPLVRGAVILALALAPACGGDDPAAPGDPPVDAAPSPDGPVAPVTCTGREAQPLDATWTLTVGGVARTFDVHVPASYDPTRASPVVLNFHGYTSNAAQEALLSRMNARADAEGFVVVYPQGTGATPSWNAGACCGTAASDRVDDVGFVGAVLDELEARLCVDVDRVFATGMSNGGFLSHRLGCELSDRIAAIAPVAGVLGVETCAPARPVPVMQFHGTQDGLVPYEGNPQNGFPSVASTISRWTTRNGCVGEPSISYQQGDSTCRTSDTCAGGSEVILCTVDGGGHTWPGGFPVPNLGHTTTDLDATLEMWRFFQRHPMP